MTGETHQQETPMEDAAQNVPSGSRSPSFRIFSALDALAPFVPYLLRTDLLQDTPQFASNKVFEISGICSVWEGLSQHE